MAKSENVRATPALPQLAHPVYLDTEMLISFLASLEDGVSYSSEVAEHYTGTSGREAEGSGKVSLPSIATLLGLTLSAGGSYKRNSSSEEGVESKFVREHTAASLFNRLRLRLTEIPNALTHVQSPDAFEGITSGSLVEIKGQIIGNPLKQILDLLAAIGPYFGLTLDESGPETTSAKSISPRTPKRSGPQGKTSVPQLGAMPGQQSPNVTLQDLLRILKREIERSPVLDLLMEGPGNIKIVLTVSRDLLTPEVEAHLIGGSFSVIGKASAVLDSSQNINLIRRTAFGFGGRKFADQLFGDFNKSMADADGLDLSLAQAIIDGPAIQVLPLAIYL